jgi:hypothetical protein
LVSGKTIHLSDDKEFKLSSVESRSIFYWYYKNRSKWAGQNRIEDVKAIVEHIKIIPPDKSITFRKVQKKDISQIHLKKIKAHRFAGIHKYSDKDDCPEDFEFNFQKPITLIEGDNGAGKTSLVNAIIWCLTGYIYRPQRLPEKIEEEIEVFFEDVNNQEIVKKCPAITPIPEAKVLESFKDNEIFIDTWVELSFGDNSGNEVAKVKRTMSRTPRGRLNIDCSGIDPT